MLPGARTITGSLRRGVKRRRGAGLGWRYFFRWRVPRNEGVEGAHRSGYPLIFPVPHIKYPYPVTTAQAFSYEERFERTYGFFHRYLQKVIYHYLDCGDLHNGFAHVTYQD